MSCGQIALNRAGIKYNTYYASEIDKYAIKVTQANYPNTVQLGDITQITGASLPKIDLLIGGSPCQGFSAAGKQAQFDDPRSKLFWEFTRLLKETMPRYFLLENVHMKKESQQVITNALGVEPIMINSALVSAQSRKRWYWTNIPNVTQPTDKGILLQDILCETVHIEKTLYITYENFMYNFRHACNKHRDSTRARVTALLNSKDTYATSFTDKSYALLANESNNISPNAVNRYFTRQIGNCVAVAPNVYRRLTLAECERLQTVPENYTAHVSDSQRKRMLGNGWTVDVIAHILEAL